MFYKYSVTTVSNIKRTVECQQWKRGRVVLHGVRRLLHYRCCELRLSFFWRSLTHIFEIMQDDIYVARKNTPVDVSEVPLSEMVDKNIFGTLSDLEIFRGHSFRIKYDVIKKL